MSEHSYSTRRPRRDRQQSNAASIPGLNQTRRSWTTPGGMHCTVESTTYTSPGFGFNFSSGSTGGLSRDFAGPSRSRTTPTAGTGLLGGALNLLDELVTAQRQRSRQYDSRRRSRQGRRTSYVDDAEETDSETEEDDDDGLAYGASPQSTRPSRSVFSKIKDRLIEGSRNDSSEEPAQRPRPRRMPSGRQPRIRAEEPTHRSYTERSIRPPFSGRHREYEQADSVHDGTDNDATAETLALQQDVERKQRKYAEAKRRFQLASQGTMINSVYLRGLLDEVQLQERSLARAEQRLRDAQGSHQRSRPAPQNRARPSMSRQQSARTDSETDDEEDEEDWHNDSFETFFGAPHHHDPMFHVFDDFHAFDPFGHHRAFNRLFAQMGNGFAFAEDRNGFPFQTMPDGSLPKRPRYTAGAANGSYQQQSFNAQPSAGPRGSSRPSNALRAEEASQLLRTYNARWLALPANSPDVPFPTRTIQAKALTDASTVPHAGAASFSSEQIMQLNAQVFFLLALGIKPEISDTGVIGFNRYAPGEAKLQELVEILKKEKVRWHSDRLGRRNGGRGDVNEVLQKDERARAVFHGVCGLMEYALQRQ